MKIVALTSLVVISAICSNTALAGPFGLKMGMSLTEIDAGRQPLACGKYPIGIVPEPDSAFESYTVQVGPESGLCWVKAVGRKIVTNSEGAGLKENFYKIKAGLDRLYGSSNTVDRLLPGSKWDKPNDWMEGLFRQERFLFAVWDQESGANPGNDIVSITAMANPVGKRTGYIAVDYSFANKVACDNEITVGQK
jgi:hypothetical protein